jgi:hypothetical protein
MLSDLKLEQSEAVHDVADLELKAWLTERVVVVDRHMQQAGIEVDWTIGYALNFEGTFFSSFFIYVKYCQGSFYF